MIQLDNFSYNVSASEQDVRLLCAKKLSINQENIGKINYIKKSIDARKKNDVKFVCSVIVEILHKDKTSNKVTEKDSFSDKDSFEDKIISKCVKNGVSAKKYVAPEIEEIKKVPFEKQPSKRPVVCGFGPAGMFCAYYLSMAGLKPIVIERGLDADGRIKAIEKFHETHKLDTKTNIQFGEGGAGTFSDGKLTTNINDKRCGSVLRIFYQCGAPEEILYIKKPHLGTDNLCKIVKNLRNKIIENGGDVHFLTQMTDIETDGGHVKAVICNHEGEILRFETDRVIIASGHSARDIFELMKNKNVKMERKPFSIGVRVEHSQEKINRAQYGEYADILPPADYKLFCHLDSGRCVYTFCMCPGGEVVAAASEEGHLVVNGMSKFARDGKNANSAVLVNVDPDDFGGNDILSGVDFQQKYEKAAFELGGGDYTAPCQLLGDFLNDKPSLCAGDIIPSYPLGVKFTEIKKCLPDFAVSALREAFPLFGKKINGFCDENAVLTGVETRSSSPVRILRDENFVASLNGIYPCGEGAGYAGGITSAAVDGIRIAQAIIGECIGE